MPRTSFDLRQCRLKPLSMRLNADPYFQSPVWLKSNRRLLVTWDNRGAPGGKHSCAMRGLLGEGGKSKTDQTAVSLAEALSFAHGSKVDQATGAAQALG
jgi:hypothetical protein